MRSKTGRAAGLAIALLGAWVYRPVLRGEALAGRDVFRMAIPDCAFILESLSFSFQAGYAAGPLNHYPLNKRMVHIANLGGR